MNWWWGTWTCAEWHRSCGNNFFPTPRRKETQRTRDSGMVSVAERFRHRPPRARYWNAWRLRRNRIRRLRVPSSPSTEPFRLATLPPRAHRDPRGQAIAVRRGWKGFPRERERPATAAVTMTTVQPVRFVYINTTRSLFVILS